MNNITLHGYQCSEEIQLHPSRSESSTRVIKNHDQLRDRRQAEHIISTGGLIFTYIPGYNWELTFTHHPRSIIPINSEFHNAELSHIAIKSHRRCAYDLHRARGKRNRRSHMLVESHDGRQLQLQSKCPNMIIFPRFNSGRRNFSTSGVLPFSNLHGFDSRSCNNEQLYCVKSEVIP